MRLIKGKQQNWTKNSFDSSSQFFGVNCLAKHAEIMTDPSGEGFLFWFEGVGEGGFADHLIEDGIAVGVNEIAEGDFAC